MLKSTRRPKEIYREVDICLCHHVLGAGSGDAVGKGIDFSVILTASWRDVRTIEISIGMLSLGEGRLPKLKAPLLPT